MRRHSNRDKQAKGLTLHPSTWRVNAPFPKPQARASKGPKRHGGLWCVHQRSWVFMVGTYYSLVSLQAAQRDSQSNLAQARPDSYGPECYIGLEQGGMPFKEAQLLARQLRQEARRRLPEKSFSG